MEYKTLPNSELELMMILWEKDEPMTRMEIEDRLPKKRHLSKTTILSFLSRLEEKGFVQVEKVGRNNCYLPIVKKDDYLRQEGSSILQKLFGNSVKKLVASLYDGDNLTKDQIEELKDYLDNL